MPQERCLCNTNWNVHMPHGVNRYYSWVGPWFYPFRGDGKALGITPGAVTSMITICGNIGFSPSSGVKGKEGRRALQEEEWLVSKLGNIILLENGLHLCYRVLVKSLIAGIVTNCTFIILCSEWEAGTWFVKCWVPNSFSWSRCELCFDPLKHYKTGNNLKSEAMGILPARPSPVCWWSVWSQPHHAEVLSG